LKVSDLLAYNAGVIRLQPEIKLLVQAAFQFTHYEHNAIAFAEWSIFRGKARYLVQDFDIDLNALAHSRTLYLDRHLVAVMQHCVVYLSHRCCGERLTIEG